MSSSSDSNSDSSSGSSQTSIKTAPPINTDQIKRIVPPIVERKLALRNALEMFQVDEEYEGENHTITGKTATDVVLPDIIREARHNNKRGKQSVSQRQQ